MDYALQMQEAMNTPEFAQDVGKAGEFILSSGMGERIYTLMIEAAPQILQSGVNVRSMEMAFWITFLNNMMYPFIQERDEIGDHFSHLRAVVRTQQYMNKLLNDELQDAAEKLQAQAQAKGATKQ
jgi:hypothetical protein